MPPTKPESTQHTPTSTSRITTPGEVNYAFLHRGSVILATQSGLALRMEVYQRRSFDRLSLAN